MTIFDVANGNAVKQGSRLDGTVVTATPAAWLPNGNFEWQQPRAGAGNDDNLWVAKLDGSGLRQLTTATDPAGTTRYQHGSVTWSPDSQWIAGVLYFGSSTVNPVFPADAPFPGGVAGTTACPANPVFVLPVTASKVAITWPQWDAGHGVKVRRATGSGGQWVSTCGTILHWID